MTTATIRSGRGATRRRALIGRTAFAGPGLLYVTAFMTIPLLIIASYTVLTRGRFGGVTWKFTLENFAKALDPTYLSILGNSLLIAGITTALALLLGYPTAYGIARLPQRWRTVALVMVVLPFWSNFLIRTYAWILLLNREGILSDGLSLIGLGPIEVLYTREAVILGLTYAYIPLMVLPIYASLQRLDPQLLEAAQNLGAGAWRRVRTILLPPTLPGIITGCLFVFIPSLGNFVIPELLGGGNSQMIGNLIRDQFLKSRDWPFGSALSLMVLALLVVIVMLQAGAARRSRKWGA